MRDNFDRDELIADFKERVGKFEEYFNNPDQKHKIFTPLENVDGTLKSS